MRARGLLSWWIVILLGPTLPLWSRGVVVAGEEEACQVGLQLLARGGNAVDAAVGGALVLAVVHPEAGNLGGGGFAVVRIGEEVAVLDFRETAPRRAHLRMFASEAALSRPELAPSRTGGLAVAVPGSPAGYQELHRRFGRLPWQEVVAPAQKLAREGFALGVRTARQLAIEQDRLARFPGSEQEWLPQGTPRAAGEWMRLPALAQTLERYVAEGSRALTHGPLAEAIVKTVHRHGGILDLEDLASYRPIWREALEFELRGWRFATVPLPSSGGYLLAAMAGILERVGWAGLPRFRRERAHRFAEAARRAYRDRLDFGDPEVAKVDLRSLLAPSRLASLGATIDLVRATPSSNLLSPPGTGPSFRESQETTHLSVIDHDGNAVALTTTINEIFGSAIWVPEVGIFLNNEMDDFTTDPARPNAFGLIQGVANAIGPGKRPLSSMTPVVGVRGSERVAVGGRGGSRIPTGVLQVLLAWLEGDSALGAVTRPRLHHQFLPDQLEIEPGALRESDRTWLESVGHRLVTSPAAARVSLAVRMADGRFACGPDPRGPEVCMLR